MAVIIRLRRDGTKNSPYYRIVVADKHSPRDGKFLELIGTYDPKKKDDNSTVKLARVDHWMKLGALPSPPAERNARTFRGGCRCAMPPSVTAEMAKGFTLYMLKAVLNGRADEIVELARSNLRR